MYYWEGRFVLGILGKGMRKNDLGVWELEVNKGVRGRCIWGERWG